MPQPVSVTDKRAIVGDRQDVGAELGDLVGAHRIGLDGQRAAALSTPWRRGR
jgi:hypothetical protein